MAKQMIDLDQASYTFKPNILDRTVDLKRGYL